jgi:uncharacterized glyoxalase superfamily protein PhnB
MNPAPENFPRLTSAVIYQDAATAIDWLCDAFGFELRLKVEGDDGQILHSELTYGDGVIMVAQESREAPRHAWQTNLVSPRSTGGKSTQSLMLYVDDADAHCAHARSRGATIAEEPTTSDYGDDHPSDRGYCAIDPEGHFWWITQRLRSPAKQ